jgi:O-glycosyl hydrolase
LKYLALLIISISLFTLACEDNFTDPNDPQFGSGDKGLKIYLDQPHQTIHHFGASDGWSVEIIGENWPVADRENISELLFSKSVDQEGNPEGIGLSMWRTNLGAGSANMSSSGFASDAWFRETECALQPNGIYDWSQQAGTRWFLRKAKEFGVDYITAWITSPPYFMTKNGYTFITPGTAGYNLKEDEYSNFAAYISEYINYHSDQGIAIDYISPINEPQYEWSSVEGSSKQEGTRCSNNEAYALVEAINAKFLEEAVITKIIIPESGDLSALHSYKNNYPNASDQVRAFWTKVVLTISVIFPLLSDSLRGIATGPIVQ